MQADFNHKKNNIDLNSFCRIQRRGDKPEANLTETPRKKVKEGDGGAYRAKALALCSMNSQAKVKDQCQKLLEQNGYGEDIAGKNMIKNILNSISPDKKIAKVQGKVIRKLVEQKFEGLDIKEIVSSFLCGENIAKIREELLYKMLKETNYENQDIAQAISVISNIERIAELQEKTFIDILDKNILGEIRTYKDDPKMFASILSYIKDRPEANIDEILSYMAKINFKDLANKAPLIKDFNFQQYLIFSEYHLKANGEKELSEEELKFGSDLTKFLGDNFLDSDSLSDLFGAFPLTKREVGHVPDDWLNEIPKPKKDEAIEKIYDAINNFIQSDEDVQTLSEELTSAIGKKTNIEYAGIGGFGTGYKITIDGARTTCLKIFRGPHVNNNQGEHAEVQMGLFLNQHSNDFVRMYFGKVAPYQMHDAFLVTQFMDEETEPDGSIEPNTEKYLITPNDTFMEHNVINGMIIDYGDVTIANQNMMPVKSFDIFEILNKNIK